MSVNLKKQREMELTHNGGRIGDGTDAQSLGCAMGELMANAWS
jgi:hypothetical protein